MLKIALIGSTGSIGRQVLNVVRRHSDKFSIVSMSAGNNAKLFYNQLKEFKPKVATIVSQCEYEKEFKETEFYFGTDAYVNAIIDEADIVVISVVGFTGLKAVIKSIEKGKNIALANKESLVVGGSLVTKLANDKGVSIVPIDSEHSAIFQALNFNYNTPFRKIILTASGGAFRDKTEDELKAVKASDALKHPTWQMGAKITVDCATLVNKGFEVIEAKWLYNTTFDKIDVIIHRESIIHSMVEFDDGAVMAQLSYPTMELPITLALNYPKRIDAGLKSLNFAELKSLSFEAPDTKRFPCLKAVIESGKKGGLFPAVINGANEQAVKLFLQDKISFGDIYRSLDGAVNAFKGGKSDTYEDFEYANTFGVEFVKQKFGD